MAIMMITIATVIITTIINNRSSNNRAQMLLRSAGDPTFPAEISNALAIPKMPRAHLLQMRINAPKRGSMINNQLSFAYFGNQLREMAATL